MTNILDENVNIWMKTKKVLIFKLQGEKQLRCKLAAVYRLIHINGWSQVGHICNFDSDNHL